MLIIKNEVINTTDKETLFICVIELEKLLKLKITGNNKIPAPAGEGTPVKKFSNHGLLVTTEETLNLANLKQQQITKRSVASQPKFPYIFNSHI